MQEQRCRALLWHGQQPGARGVAGPRAAAAAGLPGARARSDGPRPVRALGAVRSAAPCMRRSTKGAASTLSLTPACALCHVTAPQSASDALKVRRAPYERGLGRWCQAAAHCCASGEAALRHRAARPMHAGARGHVGIGTEVAESRGSDPAAGHPSFAARWRGPLSLDRPGWPACQQRATVSTKHLCSNFWLDVGELSWRLRVQPCCLRRNRFGHHQAARVRQAWRRAHESTTKSHTYWPCLDAQGLAQGRLHFAGKMATRAPKMSRTAPCMPSPELEAARPPSGDTNDQSVVESPR